MESGTLLRGSPTSLPVGNLMLSPSSAWVVCCSGGVLRDLAEEPIKLL